jgi:hypothetical protein
MNKKAEEFCEVCQNASSFPSDIHFFFIERDKIIRLDGGEFSSSSYTEEFGFITNLSLNREGIIDVFAKLEYFINEFIQLKFCGMSFEHTTALNEVLEHIDLDRRLRLIKQWDFISGSLLDKLTRAIKVRNQLAHIWNAKRTLYGKQHLSKKEVFEKFKGDLKSIFEQLIERYKQEQEKFDFEAYIDTVICKIQES